MVRAGRLAVVLFSLATWLALAGCVASGGDDVEKYTKALEVLL